jgi:hypothetical protein
VYRAMDQWSEIRRRVLTEGLSKREARAQYGMHWKTLEKMLAHVEPPGYRQRQARRIFVRLQVEHGYAGCESIVRAAVAAWRLRQAEVFVPLSLPPDQAQADFGEAEVVIAGERTTASFFVLTLPYSDAFFCCVFPKECTETFQEGHVRAFAYFGGVPRRISYDNSKIAAATIVRGRGGAPTREFFRLISHFLFAHHFCRVRRANEKGHVECMVGFARRNFLVPIPQGRLLGGAQPHSAGALPRRPGRPPARPECSQAGTARPGAFGTAAAAGAALRGAAGGADPGQLPVAGALRRQRLLGAHGLRPPGHHGGRRGRRSTPGVPRPRGGPAPPPLG